MLLSTWEKAVLHMVSGKVLSFQSIYRRQLLVPRGFVHGFMTLTPNVNFMYKCDNYYNAEADAGIAFNDKNLGLDWQIDLLKAIISEKDKKLPTFKEFEKNNDFVHGEVEL